MNESFTTTSTDNSIISKENIFNSSYESKIENEENILNLIIDSICLEYDNSIKDYESKGLYANYDIFYLSSVPPVSLKEYLSTVVRFAEIELSTLINAVIYIDLFCGKNKYVLTYHNIYRIFIATLLLSLKMNEDKIYSTKSFARITGVSFDDIKNLEYTMALKLNFSFHIKKEKYQKYYDYFVNLTAGKKAYN